MTGRWWREKSAYVEKRYSFEEYLYRIMMIDAERCSPWTDVKKVASAGGWEGDEGALRQFDVRWEKEYIRCKQSINR
jgi:hypothetical protein